MNPNTLEVFRGTEAIQAALAEGQPLIDVPEEVAEGTRATRRAFAQEHARQQRQNEALARIARAADERVEALKTR